MMKMEILHKRKYINVIAYEFKSEKLNGIRDLKKNENIKFRI